MIKKICSIGLVGVLTLAPITNSFGVELNPNEDTLDSGVVLYAEDLSAPVITFNLPNGIIGQGYEGTIEVDAGEIVSVIGLPSGLSFNPDDNTVSGVPEEEGDFDIEVNANNGDEVSEAREELSIDVIEAPIIKNQSIDPGGKVPGMSYPNSTVEIFNNDTAEFIEVEADENGNFSFEAPEEVGSYNYSATAIAFEWRSQKTDFIVNVVGEEASDDGEEDPVDNRSIDVQPNRISSSDFVKSSKGVRVNVEGFDEGEKVSFKTGGQGAVAGLQLDEMADADGKASFHLYGNSPSHSVYVGEYDVEVRGGDDTDNEDPLRSGFVVYDVDSNAPTISTNLPIGETGKDYKGTITTDVGEITDVDNLPTGLEYKDGVVSGTPVHNSINKVIVRAENGDKVSTEIVILEIKDPVNDESPIGEDPVDDNKKEDKDNSDKDKKDNSKDDNSKKKVNEDGNDENKKEDEVKKKVSTGEVSDRSNNNLGYYVVGGLGLLGLISLIGLRKFKK